MKETRTRAEVDAIVHRIAEEMASGAWVTGTSSTRIAKELGLSASYVRSLATTASRMVWAGERGDLERLRATTIARLEVISAKAEVAKQYTAAVNALGVAADVAGIRQRTPLVSVDVTLAHGEVKATVDQMRRMVELVQTFIRERHPELVPELKAYMVKALGQGGT